LNYQVNPIVVAPSSIAEQNHFFHSSAALICLRISLPAFSIILVVSMLSLLLSNL
jgi:hypothetical protein